MRTLIALALLTSSASAAVRNTPAEGYMRLRLIPGHAEWIGAIPTGSYIPYQQYTQAYTPGPYGEQFGDLTSRSLWINSPNIALWNLFSNVPFYHDFTIELALGIPELTVVEGLVDPWPAQTRNMTYSAPGYVRQAKATFTPAPEPGAGAMMLAAMTAGILIRRRGTRGSS